MPKKRTSRRRRRSRSSRKSSPAARCTRPLPSLSIWRFRRAWWPRKSRRPRFRKSRRATGRKATSSSGCPATGPGMRTGTATSGSAPAGAPLRPDVLGAGLLGPRAGRMGVGPRFLDAGRDAEDRVSPGPAGDRERRTAGSAAVAGRHLGAPLPLLVRGPLCPAAGVLGARAAGLDLGAVPLRLDPARLCLRRGALGLRAGASRRVVCAGLPPAACPGAAATSPTRRASSST